MMNLRFFEFLSSLKNKTVAQTTKTTPPLGVSVSADKDRVKTYVEVKQNRKTQIKYRCPKNGQHRHFFTRNRSCLDCSSCKHCNSRLCTMREVGSRFGNVVAMCKQCKKKNTEELTKLVWDCETCGKKSIECNKITHVRVDKCEKNNKNDKNNNIKKNKPEIPTTSTLKVSVTAASSSVESGSKRKAQPITKTGQTRPETIEKEAKKRRFIPSILRKRPEKLVLNQLSTNTDYLRKKRSV